MPYSGTYNGSLMIRDYVIIFIMFKFQLRKKLLEKAREGTLKPVAQSNGESTKPMAKRKGRWDQSSDDTPSKKLSITPSSQATPSWDNEVSFRLVQLHYLLYPQMS